MLYIRSRWIPTLFVVKTTLVHLFPTLHTKCAFTLYRDGVFSLSAVYLNSSGTFRTPNIVHPAPLISDFFHSPEK